MARRFQGGDGSLQVVTELLSAVRLEQACLTELATIAYLPTAGQLLVLVSQDLRPVLVLRRHLRELLRSTPRFWARTILHVAQQVHALNYTEDGEPVL